MHGLTDGNLFPGFPPDCPLLMVLVGWQLANQTKIKMQDSAEGVCVSVCVFPDLLCLLHSVGWQTLHSLKQFFQPPLNSRQHLQRTVGD